MFLCLQAGARSSPSTPSCPPSTSGKSSTDRRRASGKLSSPQTLLKPGNVPGPKQRAAVCHVCVLFDLFKEVNSPFLNFSSCLPMHPSPSFLFPPSPTLPCCTRLSALFFLIVEYIFFFSLLFIPVVYMH